MKWEESKMVQFIHAADLHLDSPFIGLKSLPPFLWEQIYQSTFKSLEKIVDLAIDKQVDFVCLAGDIYDSDDRSVKAQAYLRNELIRLESAEIPVFICHGNHDYIENTGLHLTMPKNVTIFNEEVETHWLTTKKNERIAITSFSYPKRWVRERMIESYPKREETADYHIGMLHGSVDGVESEHGTYAPFTLTELKNKNYDYWALGHIHKRQILSENPLVIYSGNTQGRNSKELNSKGCEWIQLTAEAKTHQFYSTATIQWEKVQLSLKGIERLGDVYQTIQEFIQTKKNNKQSLFIELRLTDSESLALNVRKKINSGELLEAVQQVSETDDVIIWVHRIVLEKETVGNNQFSFMTKEWQEAINLVAEESWFNEATNFLFEEGQIEDYVDSRDQRYRELIITEAKERIIQQLGIEGSEKNEN